MFRPVCLLALLSVSAAEIKFTHKIDGGSVMISPDDTEFHVLASPEFKQFNWASVYVDGHQLTIETPDCRSIETEVEKLSEEERRVLEGVSAKLRSVEKETFARERMEQSSRMLSGPSESDAYSLEYGRVKLEKTGTSHYLVQSESLLVRAAIKWLIVDSDLVTFIWTNGNTINMQPYACLNSQTRQLLAGVHQELIEAKEAKQKEEVSSWGENKRNYQGQIDELYQSGRDQFLAQVEEENKEHEEIERLRHEHFLQVNGQQFEQSERHYEQLMERLEQQPIEGNLIGDLKQSQSDLRRQRAELVDQIKREFEARFKAERSLRREIAARALNEFANREAAMRRDVDKFQQQIRDNLEFSDQQREMQFSKALGTETWFKIIDA